MKKEKRLPGPGSYMQADEFTNESSVLHSNPKTKIPQANDRWRGYISVQGPPCNRYDIKEGMNYNISSTHKKPICAVFGSNEKTFVQEKWKLGEKSK